MALVLGATMAAALLIGTPSARSGRASVCMGPLHDLTAKAMDGAEVDLKSLAGKNVVALNVASR